MKAQLHTLSFNMLPVPNTDCFSPRCWMVISSETPISLDHTIPNMPPEPLFETRFSRVCANTGRHMPFQYSTQYAPTSAKLAASEARLKSYSLTCEIALSHDTETPRSKMVLRNKHKKALEK